MSSPRIVVLMSVYNEAAHLHETLPAALGQSVEDFRLLVLDNGSVDGSWDMLRVFERWGGASMPMTLLRADRNLMPGVVTNLLMTVATTLWPDCDWFLSAGADDLMHPEYLAAILKAAECHPDANLIFSPWRYIDGKRPDKTFPEFDPETCHAVHQIPAWSALRRDLVRVACPWDTDIIAADWVWVARNRHNIRPVQLPAPYIELRVREGERVTQSDEVHWPTLHNLLCRIANKPAPSWARGAMAQC